MILAAWAAAARLPALKANAPGSGPGRYPMHGLSLADRFGPRTYSPDDATEAERPALSRSAFTLSSTCAVGSNALLAGV